MQPPAVRQVEEGRVGVAGKAPAHDRRAQLQHVLRPVQGPGHTTTLHPRGSDVLAGAFHRAAADWQVLLSVLRVVHALAVCLEVVDLALYLVTVLAVTVAQLLQVVDHDCPAFPQSGAPLLQMLIELRRALPVEELAHLRKMIDGVAEIQDVYTVVSVVDLSHPVPDPLSAIADEHQAQFPGPHCVGSSPPRYAGRTRRHARCPAHTRFWCSAPAVVPRPTSVQRYSPP